MQSFDATGAPFSMLTAMRGGEKHSQSKDRKDRDRQREKLGGSKKDHKMVLEAWKSFKKEVKDVKDRSVKLRISRAGELLKSKSGGDGETNAVPNADPNGVPNASPTYETNDEPEMNEETEGEEPKEDKNEATVEYLLEQNQKVSEAIDEIQKTLIQIKDKVGIEDDDYAVAMAAIESLTKFVNKHSAEKMVGGKKKKHIKGGTQGQYELNNIYAPESNSDVVIGGKKQLKKKSMGGTYASTTLETYVLPTHGGERRRRSRKSGGEYANADNSSMAPDLGVNSQTDVSSYDPNTNHATLGGGRKGKKRD